jgi:inhibitor of KinA
MRPDNDVMQGLMQGFPEYRAVGEHALMVEFSKGLDDAAHARVLMLDECLAAAPPTGFREAVPAYVSILIVFDPLLTDHGAIRACVADHLQQPVGMRRSGAPREVLVCYDADVSPDLVRVAEATSLTVEAVIAAHLAGDYRVFMYGFAPGYAYLGGVPASIQLPRKTAPLRNIAAGSVLIAGPQCLVTTMVMPTGWWIIGRSPTRVLDAGSQARPFLFDVGDSVIFRRINRAELGVLQPDMGAP